MVKAVSHPRRKMGRLQTANGSANESHYRPDDGRHANFERRPFEILHVDEHPQAVEFAGSKALHHVLPVGPPSQLGEKQVHP